MAEVELLDGPGGADKSEQFAENLRYRFNEIESLLTQKIT